MREQTDSHIDLRFDIEVGIARERAGQTDSLSEARRAAVQPPPEDGGQQDDGRAINVSQIQRDKLDSARKEAN